MSIIEHNLWPTSLIHDNMWSIMPNKCCIIMKVFWLKQVCFERCMTCNIFTQHISKVVLKHSCYDKPSRITSEDIERRIREKVCEVLPCDIHSSYPLGEMQEFDVVTCQLVLEGCSRTKEMYRNAASNLSRLVKQGGHLFLLSVLYSDYYIVQGHQFPVLNVDTNFVKSVFESTGFGEITFHVCEEAINHDSCVTKCLYTMHAVKIRWMTNHLESH